MLTSMMRGSGAPTGLILTSEIVALLVAGLVGPVIMIGIWGAITHAVLAATGRTSHGLGRTYQAICYSSGPNLLLAVPCVGSYLSPIAWIWWAINSIFTVRNAQRVSGVRATAAVLSAPVCACTVFALSIAFLIVPGIRSASNAAMAARYH